ncbi:hypothetical protein CMV_027855 [Castanea mollissima]|uniref:Uncharacterized protein n=1 Tax=Castanea mollissima TaxID=60419 RepID=A0A8J4V2D9_9ROSI|nr:hypothetical protein CMV_027855 [Castanea mollissima]
MPSPAATSDPLPSPAATSDPRAAEPSAISDPRRAQRDLRSSRRRAQRDLRSTPSPAATSDPRVAEPSAISDPRAADPSSDLRSPAPPIPASIRSFADQSLCICVFLFFGARVLSAKVPSEEKRRECWQAFYQGAAFPTLARFLLLVSLSLLFTQKPSTLTSNATAATGDLLSQNRTHGQSLTLLFFSGAVYGACEAIRFKVPGLMKIRYIGQTTLGSAAIFGLFLGAVVRALAKEGIPSIGMSVNL